MRIKKKVLVQALDELLSEISSTGGMVGGAGPIKTPNAFGKRNKSLKILRRYLTDTERTFKHTKKL